LRSPTVVMFSLALFASVSNRPLGALTTAILIAQVS
jgi:hypothetical protein